MKFQNALGIVRHLIEEGLSPDDAANNPAIPSEFRNEILKTLKEEENIILEPANIIKGNEEYEDWLSKEDRENWHYWPTLRKYLLYKKGLPRPSVQSLDKETDRILGMLDSPEKETFDKKGLVLGFVQSGKTSNYTALIAKAADVGYRLIIVFSGGNDNGLRLQTNRRLKNELVGNSEGKGVPLPPSNKQWVEFTQVDLDGDFQTGFINPAFLQGPQPKLMVIKKNGNVLRRLLKWLDSASEEIKKTLPLLVIDDEADLASIDTRGKGIIQTEEEPLPEDYEPPSVINGLIRKLLDKFGRRTYIAYTATPFANILIPHYNNDLYPKDFIINLPEPLGYFGAEKLFGSENSVPENEEGLDVIRPIDVESMKFFLEKSIMPPIMEKAILSFILAGAARKYRNKEDFPATMLIHNTLRTLDQEQLKKIVETKFTELMDEWKYDRKEKIYGQLRELWEDDFLPVIKTKHPDKQVNFEDLEKDIGIVFQSVQIRTLNCKSEDVQALDYEKEPNLKLIAIGGNKLSRGLTLEGLLVSFFTRRSKQYDTLMQMGRWFGFREGYEDLTRIYTTSELAGWFSDLARIESELREDIKIYEEEKLTPFEVGLRIKDHPIMQVTSPSKRRFASGRLISKSYDARCPRTINFKFKDLKTLAEREDKNLLAVKKLMSGLEKNYSSGEKYPLWKEVPVGKVISFLEDFTVDESSTEFNMPRVIDYIRKLNENGELTNWSIAICGRDSFDPNLGKVDWGLKNIQVNQINRSKDKDSDTLRNITSPRDESIDLSLEEKEKVKEFREKNYSINKSIRMARPPSRGLILLYPISKNSKPDNEEGKKTKLYEDSSDSNARNIVGLAISFPKSEEDQKSESYVEGTVPWRSADEF